MASTGKRAIKFAFEGDAKGVLQALQQTSKGIDAMNKKAGEANRQFKGMEKSLKTLKSIEWWKMGVAGMKGLITAGNKLLGVYRDLKSASVELYRGEQMALRQRASILKDRPGLKVGAGFQKKVDRLTQGQGRFGKGDVDQAANLALTFARDEADALRLLTGAINTAAGNKSNPLEVMRNFKAADEGSISSMSQYGGDIPGIVAKKEAIGARLSELSGTKGMLSPGRSAALKAEEAALMRQEEELGRRAIESTMRRNAGAANTGDSMWGRFQNTMAPAGAYLGGVHEEFMRPYYNRGLKAARGMSDTITSTPQGQLVSGTLDMLKSGDIAKILAQALKDSQIVSTVGDLFKHGAGVIIEALKLGMDAALDMMAERTSLVSKRTKPSEQELYRDVFRQSGEGTQAMTRQLKVDLLREAGGDHEKARALFEDYQEGRGRALAREQGLDTAALEEQRRYAGLNRELAGLAEAGMKVPGGGVEAGVRGLEAGDTILRQAAARGRSGDGVEMMLRQQQMRGAGAQL